MNRVVQLLNEKNHFLEKFYSINEKQISLLENGQIDKIDYFYQQREDLLKILKYIDSEMQKAYSSKKELNESFSDEQKQSVRECLKIKEIYVKKIIEQDLIILSLIDDMKSQIIKELKDVKQARKALSGYKSSVA